MKVFVGAKARQDILRQYEYYLDEKHVAAVADRFLDAVQSAIEALRRMPDTGAPRFFANPHLAGLRSWPVSGFPATRIYYIHSGDELRIVRVLHGKRDVGMLLEAESAEAEE